MEVKAISLKELRKVEKLPTDVFEFDLLTQGGIPEGRFTLFWGAKSSGKSTMALRCVKAFLEKYPDRKACYVDFEQAFDPAWAIRIVGETDNLLVVQPSYAEEGIQFLKETIGAPEIGLYVIDSLAMMIPVTEAEASADQDFVGLQARVVNKLLRKLLPHVAKHTREGNSITVILINQCRSSIGKSTFVQSYSKPGGLLQDFITSLEVRFYVESVEKGENNLPISVEFAFVIEKNKTGGVPKTVGKYTMALTDIKEYKAGEVIDAPRILSVLKKYGLMQKVDKGYEVFGEVFRTQNDLKEKLREDISYKREITERLLNTLKESI